MAKGRSINKFFSPRVQGQYIPQFVEEPFPFESAFLVGAGQQKRLDDLMAQATELGQVPTRPIEEDILQRNQIVGDLRTEIEEILGQKGGDPGQAARDISRAIARTRQKPFFMANEAELAKYGEDIKAWGELEDPLARDTSRLTEPLYDPATGERNVLGYEAIETPDYVQQMDERYEDIKAKVTEKISKVETFPGSGVYESVTTKVLTDAKLRETAKEDVDSWMRNRPWWGDYLKEQGVKPSGYRKATEEFLYDDLKFKAQSDRSVEYVKVSKDSAAAGAEAGVGAGRDIVVTSGEDQSEYTLASEHEFSPRKKTGAPYKLIVNPTYMYDLTDFTLAETETGELDFMLDKVIDLKSINKNFPELEIKKSQPFPEEGMAMFYEPERFETTEEVRRNWLGRILYKEDVKTVPGEPKEVPADVSQVKPENIGREWYASGRIKGKEKDTDPRSATRGQMITTEKSVLIPYRFIKRSIEESTGFKADDSLLGYEYTEEFEDEQGNKVAFGRRNGKWFNVSTGKEAQ